jgi:hypothetical protein
MGAAHGKKYDFHTSIGDAQATLDVFFAAYDQGDIEIG